MSTLPIGWTLVHLGDVIALNPKNNAPDEAEAGFSPMNLLSTNFCRSVGFEPKPWGEIKKNYTHFADGDVLLAKITPCFENGKAGLVESMPSGIGAGSSEYFVCRPKAGVLEARYLLAHFKTDAFLRAGMIRMTGSVGHKRVPKEYLFSSKISLAPIKEQKRIADKLGAILEQANACRDRLDHVPAILKRFRQTVLSSATSGTLTDKWRKERGISDNWTRCEVQSIARVSTGSTPLRSNPNYFASAGTPWITSAATSQPVVTEAQEYVTDAAIVAHRLKKYPIGTLLVAMYGEGKTRGQVTELGIEATINQACAAVVVDTNQALKNFVKLALQANYFEMRELAEGGNQPNLNLSKVKSFPLQLPSRAEQLEIVRRVESLFAWADSLEARCTAARSQVERLTPALLAKAFRGELVPQDPADEPASELLKRLGRRPTDDATGPAKRRSADFDRTQAASAAPSA